MKSDEVFQLGAFQFESSGPTLRDENGAIVPLRHQSLKVLGYLCQNAGTIVTKADLNERVWGNTFVTDASLVQCIREIRRALQDNDYAMVKTFPRQGYMIETSLAAMTNRKTDPGTAVVAVCQFLDRSTGADQNVLSDGIAEDLITALSRYAELSVVSRQASFGFEAAENRSAQIVERTGAQYILTGYQQKSGQKLHVGVALIDAKTDKNIWIDSYDLDARELLNSQREVVEKIATAVEYLIPNFTPEAGGIGKAAALGYHLRARTEFMKFTETSLMRAEELGLKAIEADPTSPHGYLSLSFVHLCRHEFGLWHNGPGEDLAAADENAEKALALAPNSANAIMTRGVVFMNQGRLEDALACFEKTMLLNPNYSANRMNYAEALALTGDIPAALKQVELAYKRNGVRPGWHYENTAFILWVAGRNQEAVNYLRNVPSVPLTSIPFKSALLASNGDVQAAKAEMANFTAERPNHTLKIERFVVGTKFRDADLADRWLAALKMAGMPE
jgi:TolB-like protein